MLRSKVLIYFAFISSLFAKDIIAILDLEQIGLTPQEAQILTQRLTTKLISLNKYQIVERNNMDKILKEQKFQHSGCTDAECAVEIGQLLNSDYIVTGSVNKFGDTYALDARLIDVGLGKSIISAEFSMTGKIDALLTTGITSVAKQLCGMPAATTLNQSTQSRAPITSSGYLHTAFNPQNTRITIDGDIVANNSTTKLNTGRYILTANLTNYYLVNKAITINRNDTAYINQTLKYGLDDYKKIQKHKKKGFYGAVVSTSVTAISYFITGMLYNKYVDAEAAQDATDFRNQTELFHTMSNISGLITASVWGYTLYNYKTEKSLKKKLDLNE